MFLPVHIQMANRPCLVVGGSDVAARKCQKLLEHGAVITAVAPLFNDDPVWTAGGVTLVRQGYEPGLLTGMFLAVAATDDLQVNTAVLADAEKRGVLAQRTDLADAGDFFLPATLRQGALTVSFATDGVNPAFSRMLRDEAAAAYDDAFGNYCTMTEELRCSAPWHQLDKKQRKSGLRAMARCSNKVLALIRAGKQDEARLTLEEAAGIKAQPSQRPATVCLIGAGPGDPDLITIKGAMRLRQAEVVLHDGYANPVLLDRYCPPGRAYRCR